jgi:hypothetical protein
MTHRFLRATTGKVATLALHWHLGHGKWINEQCQYLGRLFFVPSVPVA